MELKKELRFIDVYCIAAGAMISSGIFVLPGLAFARTGPSVIISYFLAGLLAAIGVLNTAELATAMPRAGGDYFFIARSLGPAVGSVAGLINWFSLSLKSAFALLGMAAFLSVYIGIPLKILAFLLGIIFVLINLFSVKHASRFQVILVFFLIILMVWFVFSGITKIKTENLTPFFSMGYHAMFATAGFVFVSYGGLLKISGVAEEVKNPSKVIPQALFSALLSVGILYTLMVLVTTGVMPAGLLSKSLTPITDASAQFMGSTGQRAIAIAAFLAFISTANAGIMAASRYLFALSRDELLPGFLSRVSEKTNIPTWSVLCTGLLCGIALFLKIDILVEAASLVLIIGFIFSCICVIVLRESKIQNYRPSFKAPFYPLLQVVGILGFGLLIFEIGVEAYFISSLLFIAGFLGYWFYGRKRASKDYALLHLISRITNRELLSGNLEEELKDIVRERDEFSMDRFDLLVSESDILDFNEKYNRDECFREISEKLAEKFQMESQKLMNLLIERENDTSTVMTPFLAIPHIIIPGSNQFDILMIRCKQGVFFSDEHPEIKCIFVLAGTKDQRNFHLRALASVAQLFQETDFEERWMNARNIEGIRDVVLLGKRIRNHCSISSMPNQELR